MADSVQTDCIATDCERPKFEVGYCRYHYSSLMKSGDLPRRRIKNYNCEAPGCDEPARRLRLCFKHIMQFDKRGHDPEFVFDSHKKPPQGSLPCAFESCGRPFHTRGLCRTHYVQSRKPGGRLIEVNRGAPCPVPGCESPGGYRRPLCKSHAYYSRQYGLTDQQVAELFVNRACGNPGCRSTERLHLDHDHSCCEGASCGSCVRGWLCTTCNTSLGLLQESRSRILGLAEYLHAR